MLKRNLSTAKNRAFWARIDKSARRAELSLPNWVKVKIKKIFSENPDLTIHEKLNKVLTEVM